MPWPSLLRLALALAFGIAPVLVLALLLLGGEPQFVLHLGFILGLFAIGALESLLSVRHR